MVNEVTGQDPASVDFETQPYLWNITYFSKIGDAIHEKTFVKLHQDAKPSVTDFKLHEMKELPNGKVEFEVRMPLKVYNPLKWTIKLTDFLSQDVKFIRKRVVGFETKDNQIISLHTSDGEVFKFDKYVLASGMSSVAIGKTLGLTIPLLAFKGLSVNVYHKEGTEIPITLIDASKQAAVVWMGNMTRITAFGDVEGTNLDLNPIRVKQIREYAKSLYPDDYDEKRENLWVGLRPVSPDDVPIIGRSSKYSNLYFNFG